MRALLAKLKGPWLFVRYIEEFTKNHVRKNEGQLYFHSTKKRRKGKLYDNNFLSFKNLLDKTVFWISFSSEFVSCIAWRLKRPA